LIEKSHYEDLIFESLINATLSLENLNMFHWYLFAALDTNWLQPSDG